MPAQGAEALGKIVADSEHGDYLIKSCKTRADLAKTLEPSLREYEERVAGVTWSDKHRSLGPGTA
jgi:hypothetical protein